MAAKKISQREARQLRARVRRLENQLDLMGNRYRDLPGIHVATICATEVQKAQMETAAQLGFVLAIRHWSTSTYPVHAIKPEEL